MMMRLVLVLAVVMFVVMTEVAAQASNQQRSAAVAGQPAPGLPKPNVTQGTGSYNPEGGPQQSAEDTAAQDVDDNQPTGDNTVEVGLPPKYPLKVVSVEAQAHDSQVSGCRDHPNASQICEKAVNPCFCEEHETYMYSYCRKSCGYCDPETSKYHKIWRLRAASSFTPSWIISELQMYSDINDNISIAMNGTNAFASSEYPGYHAFNAFDLNMNTTWMPAGWFDHKAGEDWIAYQFPIPVKITSIRISGLPEEPTATPKVMYVEAADLDVGPYRKKWTVYRNNEVMQQSGLAECPVLWRRYENNGSPYCYRLVAKFYSWGDANDFCQREQGNLASIADEDELNFILEDVKICGFVWIGLNDQRQEGAYVWSDNSRTNYTNWKKGDSYDEVQRHYEDCTTMDKEGNWYMSSCVNRNFFICKKKLVQKPPPVPPIEPPESPPFVFISPHATKPVPADEAVEQPGEEEADEEQEVQELLTTTAIQHMKEVGLQPPQTIVNSEDQSTSAAMQISNIVEQEENQTRIAQNQARLESNKLNETYYSAASNRVGNYSDIQNRNNSAAYAAAINRTQEQQAQPGKLDPPSTSIEQGPSLQQQNKQNQVDPLVAQALGLLPQPEPPVPTLPPTPGPGRAPEPTETQPIRLPKRPPPYPAPLPPANDTFLANSTRVGSNEQEPPNDEEQQNNNLKNNGGDQEAIGHENELKEQHNNDKNLQNSQSEINEGGDKEEEESDDAEAEEENTNGAKPIQTGKKPSERKETSKDTPDVNPPKPGEGQTLPTDDDEDEDDEMGEAGEEAKGKKEFKTKPTRKNNTPSPTPKEGNAILDQDDDVHPPSSQASIKHNIKPNRRAQDTTQRRREKNHKAQEDGLREKWRGFKSHDRESKKSKTSKKTNIHSKSKKSSKARNKPQAQQQYFENPSDYYTNRQMLPSPASDGYYQQPLMDLQYNPNMYSNDYQYSQMAPDKEEELPDWSEASFMEDRAGEFV